MAKASVQRSSAIRSAQDSVEVFFVNVKARADTLNIRRDQLLAALLLPFFIVTAMAMSRVLKEILIEFVPADGAGMDLVLFLLGSGLVIATFASAFWWVKTGGWGLFDA
jgi:hypothetical protein